MAQALVTVTVEYKGAATITEPLVFTDAIEASATIHTVVVETLRTYPGVGNDFSPGLDASTVSLLPTTLTVAYTGTNGLPGPTTVTAGTDSGSIYTVLVETAESYYGPIPSTTYSDGQAITPTSSLVAQTSSSSPTAVPTPGLSSGAGAGIAIGAIAGAAIIAGAIWFFARRYRLVRREKSSGISVRMAAPDVVGIEAKDTTNEDIEVQQEVQFR